MSCEFISELRRLSKLSAEAVQNLDHFDPLKKYSIVKMSNRPKPIYIKDKAFWELFLELQAQNDQQG